MADPYKIEENGELWLIERLSARSPLLAFDVGANVGDWTRHAHRLFPLATIHAFEIVPETFEVLRQRTEGLDRIVANPFGLADESGEIVVYCGRAGSVHSSILGEFVAEVEVVRPCRVMAGDDYMRESRIDHIDMLKIDAEGADHLVLKGFRDAISRGAIDVIQFEYGFSAIATHFLLYDFYRLLEAAGYVVGQLNESGIEFKPYVFLMEKFWPPNWVAVRRDRPDIIEGLGD